MKKEVLVIDMGVLIEVINTIRIERRGAAFDTVDLRAVFKTPVQQQIEYCYAPYRCDFLSSFVIH
jgi:hypothetical protein